MPYIAADTMARGQTRRVYSFANGFTAKGFETEARWTDGKELVIPADEASKAVDEYFWTTGIYKVMKRSRIKMWFNGALRPQVLPDYKVVVISVRPTVAVMVPCVQGTDEWYSNSWGSDLWTTFLDEAVVSTGTSFPASSGIKWFIADRQEHPRLLVDRAIDDESVRLVFEKKNDRIIVRREK